MRAENVAGKFRRVKAEEKRPIPFDPIRSAINESIEGRRPNVENRAPPLSPIPLEASACLVLSSPHLPEIRPLDATLARPPKPIMQACRKDTDERLGRSSLDF